ncbi:MAG: hypothetical protein FJ091_03720 [Deltaproteobacteria bacterium]|nr:hypothetical protein [Deltaproteobacteria bacterium]
MQIAYRILAGIVGAALAAGGATFFASFFVYQQPGSEAPLPGGPHAHYFAATAGCALVAWGGALLAGAVRNELSRSLGTASALAFVLLALMRMLAWFNGDYYGAGELPRIEAAVFLAAALAFVWLRPDRAQRKIWS